MACANSGLLETHGFGRFVFYKLMTAVPVTVAALAILRYADGWYWLAIYAALCLTHATVIYLNKCPHCHYYRTGGRTHRCFFIWGTPKLVRARPGPAPAFLKTYVPLAILTLAAFPVYWLTFQWELLAVYALSLVNLVYSIFLQECSRCPSFGCPNNRVPAALRSASA